MSERTKGTAIWVTSKSQTILKNLSEKTRIPVIDLIDDVTKAIDTVMNDYLKESSRVTFMASAEIQGFVLLRFAPLFSGGIDALPPELRKMVLADEKKQERKSEKVGTIKIPLKKRNENE